MINEADGTASDVLAMRPRGPRQGPAERLAEGRPHGRTPGHGSGDADSAGRRRADTADAPAGFGEAGRKPDLIGLRHAIMAASGALSGLLYAALFGWLLGLGPGPVVLSLLAVAGGCLGFLASLLLPLDRRGGEDD